jgi:hypothetical protein
VSRDLAEIKALWEKLGLVGNRERLAFLAKEGKLGRKARWVRLGNREALVSPDLKGLKAALVRLEKEGWTV